MDRTIFDFDNINSMYPFLNSRKITNFMHISQLCDNYQWQLLEN